MYGEDAFVFKESARNAVTFMEDRKAVSSQHAARCHNYEYHNIMNNNCRGNITACAGVTFNVTSIQGVTSVGYNLKADCRLVGRVAV